MQHNASGWLVAKIAVALLSLAAVLFVAVWAYRTPPTTLDLLRASGQGTAPDGSPFTGFIAGGGGPTVYTSQDGHRYIRDGGTYQPYHSRYGGE